MIEVEGINELQGYLDSLISKLTSSTFWAQLGNILEKARRYAASISPVVTGSYRGSHRVVIGAMSATLSIDPTARNGDMLVSRYAGSVEQRHQVYARTFAYSQRLAVEGAEVIGGELIK